MTEERYHLYLAPFNSETAQIALNEKYARATPDYVMLYNKGECPKGYKEMTDAELHLLPKDGLKWLNEINILVIQEFYKARMDEMERANRKFMEEFEKELQAEREKLLKQKE